MTNDSKITRMEGEILPSALTLRDSSYMEDPQQVHSYPNAKFLDEVRFSEARTHSIHANFQRFLDTSSQLHPKCPRQTRMATQDGRR